MTEQKDQNYLQTLIGQVLSASAENSQTETPTVSSNSPRTEESSSVNSASGVDPIAALLSNPELLSKLPTILSAAKPIMDILGNLNVQSGGQDMPQTAPAMASPAPSPPILSKHKADTRQTALLCALKPYLSSDRQKTIDYMLKLSDLGSVLKTLR